MKKRIIVFLTALCMLAMLAPACVTAESDAEDWLYFSRSTGAITGCDPNARGELVIPSEIDGAAVTAISGEAFEQCRKLTSVVIPDGVVSIGDKAFYQCGMLENITIPDTVSYIGSEAFYGCFSLTDIKIPDGVTEINGGTFSGCSGLTSVTIPGSVISIGSSAFYNCSGLKTISAPDGITSIGSMAFNSTAYYNDKSNWENGVLYLNRYAIGADSALTQCNIKEGTTVIAALAFYGCPNLTGVTIPDGVVTIGTSAFESCSSLWDIAIPDTVTAIGKDAFKETRLYNDEASWENEILYACSHLLHAKRTAAVCHVKDGTKTIADGAFSWCTSLTEVTIPDSVVTIGNEAFNHCESLTDIDIPDSVTYIGTMAFDICSSLTSISVPDSVAYIGPMAFAGCGKAERLVISESVKKIENYTFQSCRKLTSIEIPDGVTSIGNTAFNQCVNLKSVVIPSSVTYIEWGAFDGCGSLTDVYYGGSAEDWENITVKSYNNYLINAQIHYNSAEPPAGSFTVTSDEDGAHITNNNDTQRTACVITFRYDGEILDSINVRKSVFAASETLTFPLAENERLYVWNSIGGMKPLAELNQ